MASFLNANLPSSDEEDDDYRPDQDKTAPKEDRDEVVALADGRSGKRPRGEEEEERFTVEDMAAADALDPRKKIKKAKIDHLWQLLNSKTGNGASPAPTPKAQHRQQAASISAATPASAPEPTRVGPSASVSIAALCRTVSAKERKKTDTDVLWMRSLGITPPTSSTALKARQPPTPTSGPPKPLPSGTPPAAPSFAVPSPRPAPATLISEEARAAAAAALAAARESGGVSAVRTANKVTVTETRRFAGKDIQVQVQVDKNSKEAQKAAERAGKPPVASSGLDAFLAEVDKKKKVNVLDKTKADWQQLKASDNALEEELEAHKRSGSQYLEKVDFLKRAELREYEAERDKRLQSDVRFRGRL